HSVSGNRCDYMAEKAAVCGNDRGDSSYHYFVPGQSEGRGGCSGKADSGLGYNRCAAELLSHHISSAYAGEKRKADKREGFI
ncbi:hypothetical protein, partial [Streptococcus salivarius]|uniref:hypothetical protein n=1 Tax=Streptococcus salivarius TaxID=1304 RepID=UPI001D05EE97